jgi:hypothetical protein
MKFDLIYESLMRIFLEANADKRIEFLQKKYPNLPPELLEYVVRTVDPTHGEYSNWLMKGYTKLTPSQQSRFYEDSYKLTEALISYHKYKNKLKTSDAVVTTHQGASLPVNTLNDINRIQGYSSLYDIHEQVLKPFEHEQISQDANLELSQKIERIFSSNEWLIIVPLTYEASCKYGAGTRWCTASSKYSNFYEQYSKDGPLYILIHKETQEKWQFHFQSDSFMDSRDDQISLRAFVKDYPELVEILTTLSEKNGSEWAMKQLNPDKYVKQVEERMMESGADINLNSEELFITLKLGAKHPDVVNKAQDLFVFSEKGASIVVDDFSTLTDFVGSSRHGGEKYQVFELLDGDYPFHDNTNCSYESDYWYWIDADNLVKIKRYLKTYSGEDDSDMKLDDMAEMVEENDITEIKDALTHAMDDAYSASLNSKLYETALNAISDTFGHSFKWKDFGKKKRLVFSPKPITHYEMIVAEIEKKAEDPNDEISCNNFLDRYASHLDAEDELPIPNFDDAYNNAYPTKKENSDTFNERLSQLLADL